MATSGLDFGTTRAAFARVSVSGTTVRLESAALVSFRPDARDEPERARALAIALGADGRRGRPRLSVSGREAILRYMHLPNVPPWRLRLIMDVEVQDVAEKAGEPLAADWRRFPIPADIAGSEPEAVLVALAKEPALLARIQALEAAGVRPGAALPGSIALFDAFVGLGHVDEGTTILVDAGPEGTEVAIARDGMLVFARGIPAQRDAAAASGSISAREAQSLASAVASSVQFCRGTQKLRALPVDRVMLSGAYGRSPELLQSLRQTLKVDVATFDPLERVEASGAASAAVAGRGPELAIPIGLALATAHPRCVDLDLTPKPIVARRDFIHRTVFLYAAGGLLAASLVVAFVFAIAARSKALSRRAELSKTLAALESRRDAVDAQGRANKRAIQVVDGLAKRTQPGGAILRLLGRLREATPPRVTVLELAYEPPSDKPGARPPAGETPAAGGVPAAEAVVFRLKGVVDNAAGDAISVLGKFEASLREDPGVVSAKVTGTPVAQPGSLLEFAMAVVLRAQARGAEE